MQINTSSKSGQLDAHGSPYNQLVARPTGVTEVATGATPESVTELTIAAAGNPVYLLLADALNAESEDDE